MSEFFYENKFIKGVDHFKELEKMIDIKILQLQHLLGSDEDNTLSVLKNEHARLTSDIIRLIKHKASLSKEINGLQNKLDDHKETSSEEDIIVRLDFSHIDHKDEAMSLKDPRDIVKNILDKNSEAVQKKKDLTLAEEDKIKLRKEALDLAYQASFKDSLFNMKWPVITNPLPANPTREEVIQNQLDVLSSQLQTLFTLAKYNLDWIVTGELKDRYE